MSHIAIQSAPGGPQFFEQTEGAYAPAYPQLNRQVPQHYYQPANYPVSADVHQKTEHLLQKAGEVAQSILYPHANEGQAVGGQAKPFNLPVLPLNIDARQYHLFSSRTENHGNREKEEKNANSNQRLALFAIGAIIAGVGAYFVGKKTAQHEEIQEKGESFDLLQKHWQVNRDSYSSYPDYQEKVDVIARKSADILNRKKSNRLYGIAFAVSGLATGVLFMGAAAIGGATLASLAVPGLIVVSAASILMLGRYGYQSFSQKDKKDAMLIEINLMKARDVQFIIPNAPLEGL
jgi:hypothetical protein